MYGNSIADELAHERMHVLDALVRDAWRRSLPPRRAGVISRLGNVVSEWLRSSAVPRRGVTRVPLGC